MSNYYIGTIICMNELAHHGIIDQRWGVRRFQNPDGSLTPEGRIRYGSGKEQKKFADKITKTQGNYHNMVSLYKRSPQVRHAVSQLDKQIKRKEEAMNKSQKMIQDFYSPKNKSNRKKWVIKAVDTFMKKYPEDFKATHGKNPNRDKIIDEYLNGDLDVGEFGGPYSSWYAYTHSNDKGGKKALHAENEIKRADEAIIKAAEKYTNEFLGEYGNKVIGKDIKGDSITLGREYANLVWFATHH